MMMPSYDNPLKEKGSGPLLLKSTPPNEHKNLPQHCPHGITQFLQMNAQWEIVNEWPKATNMKYDPRALSIAPPMKRSLLH